jgi:NitT/TauT family transport system substrate-binding protein
MVEAFRRAMKTSLQYAQEHPDEVRAIVGTYTKIGAADRAKMALPSWHADFDRAAFEKLAAAAKSFGTIKGAPNLDTLLPKQ